MKTNQEKVEILLKESILTTQRAIDYNKVVVAQLKERDERIAHLRAENHRLHVIIAGLRGKDDKN